VAREAFRIAAVDGSPPYISIDIDSIDPAYAPGTNSPEPGGLTSREIITALRIVGQKGFIGFDLVEVVPELDSAAGTTSILAARLMIEALGALAAVKKRNGG
jgi:arginase family enzyme